MNNSIKKISVVIPVYNELQNIEPLLKRLHSAFKNAKYQYELIFIDDHSTDGTYKYLFSFQKDPHVYVLKKRGKKGKAYSLLEGFSVAKGDYVVMIDADLQYPPEVIIQMVEAHPEADIIVADRKKFKTSKTRKVISKTFRNLFGGLLFGLNHDIQSGLKVFRREVIQTIVISPKSGWTFDLAFLHYANQAGFTIVSHPITFSARSKGASKVNILRQVKEIGLNALLLRAKASQPQKLLHTGPSMRHAGVGYGRKRYITHSTLPHQQSAMQTFHLSQKLLIGIVILSVAAGIVFDPLQTLKILVAILSLVYFLDVLFNLFIILRSLHIPQEIYFSEKELYALVGRKDLPMYTILCPMYKESHIIPHFLESIRQLDWPKNKLDVMLLLEADDTESIEAVRAMQLPPYVRMVIVPAGIPKTKPKACNYGLSHAKGEYLVIYDAEDIPDPKQLKVAYLAFQNVSKDILCLQAKLNYFNPNQNLLTRFFTAEYSLWFDITLTGLQSLETSIPLGGTSNHFRTADLIRLAGWDPFNVTEDADLGIRLFKAGYKTAIIDSTTMEEANSRVGNWIRQRSRWIKGYMQTYLVHTRPSASFKKQNKIHALLFHLTIGGKIAFILINPILWIATFAYFAAYQYVGPTIETLYPSYIFYMALFSLVFGNFLFLFYFMIGAAKREQYGLIKYVYLIPFYWLLISIAGFMALYQLIFKPHYWEKTTHGLHLKLPTSSKAKKLAPVEVKKTKIIDTPLQGITAAPAFLTRLKALYLSGGALVVATGIANILNFIFNSYLGRTVELKYLAIVSLVGSFLYLVNVPNDALGTTVRYRSGFLAGKYDNSAAYAFWRQIRFKTFLFSLVAMLFWLGMSFWLKGYFHTKDLNPFLLFAPFFVSAFVSSIDTGYLSGKLLFGSLAFLVICEPVIKLATAFLFVQYNLQQFVYSAVPLASVITFLVGWILVKMHREKTTSAASTTEVKYFPKNFFFASVLTGLSTMMFLSLDIILATHFLPVQQAGEYALLSLSGKMVYFLGSLASQFVTPLISRNEGANKSSDKTLTFILLGTVVLSAIGFVLFGLLAHETLPILFGKRADAIVQLAPFYAFAMLCFGISRVYVQYYLVKKIYTPAIMSFLLAILQFCLITLYHPNSGAIVFCMLIVGGVNVVISVFLHAAIRLVMLAENAVLDFFGLFSQERIEKAHGDELRILIFNWRDRKHKWAGGAEVYIHEIAKRLVKDGHSVTLFCGSDGESPKKQTIDGVTVERRGGAFLVYLWAFLYYVLKFRNQYDVIIDCENGIPFFTPLFTNKEVFLVIHHVHQEVFSNHLPFPLSKIAKFLEGTCMPIVYKNKQIITVSKSSKKEIIKLGFSNASNIHIVHNGIHHELFTPKGKTTYPLFTYLGRLKAYKNIDVAIKAFAPVVTNYPLAKLSIVGEGEEKSKLERLTKRLDLSKSVTFHGKVSEKTKADLLAKSWAVLQPSMTEGWGITVIESNASGTAVIASDVNGLKDSVVDNETGILVKVGDVDGFTQAMTDILLTKSYRDTLAKNAYKWSKEFRWETSAKDFYLVILQHLEKKINSRMSQKIVLADKLQRV